MSVALESAVRQLELLGSGAISAVELAEEHIRRIEALNPKLNAILNFDAEKVRVQARGALRGRLAGLPLTIKSSIATAGYLCEVGSTLRRGQTADGDAVAVARLRAEGAVILGMTNCPEYLMAYETDNLLNGRTNNPWDLERTPGGSSGGEAAAIAAGLSAGGLGSDSGGSVREPAHFSGICALKPTSGRISAEGHRPPCVGPFATLGTIGPMARTMPDVELLFGVAAESSEDVLSVEGAKAFRIGVLVEDEGAPVTAETRRAVEDAAAVLRGHGFEVREVSAGGALREALEAARRLWDVFFMQCGAMFYEPEIRGRRGELSPVFLDFLAQAESRSELTAARLLGAWAEMDSVRAALIRAMEEYPILLTPVCSVPAFRHGERSWTIDGRSVSYLDAMRSMQWFNLLGSPAAVVPVGKSGEGLPIGVQVAGRPYADEVVMRVAAVLDGEFGWKRPVIS